MSTPEPIAPTQPIENVQRGTVFALLIVPAGIIVWVILWQIGFIASIVAFGVALGAMRLYRFGSGGPVSRTGAIRITIITVATLVLSFFAGLVANLLPAYANHYHVNPIEAITSPQFWNIFVSSTTNPDNFGSLGVSFLLALVFGALGCFSVLRTAFVQTRNASVASSAAAGYGQPVPQPYTIAPPVPPAPPAAPTEATDPDGDTKR
jgi:hypothetical protein